MKQVEGTFFMLRAGWYKGKTRTMWRGAFFAKTYPTLRKKNKISHTGLKDMFYILPFHLTSPSPPTPTDGSCAFSHLTRADQTVIFAMKFFRAFTHFTLTFIPIFLVHLFHSVTVLFFPFSYASEPTSQVELSSLYVSNFLLAHHFLQF